MNLGIFLPGGHKVLFGAKWRQFAFTPPLWMPLG